MKRQLLNSKAPNHCSQISIWSISKFCRTIISLPFSRNSRLNLKNLQKTGMMTNPTETRPFKSLIRWLRPRMKFKITSNKCLREMVKLKSVLRKDSSSRSHHRRIKPHLQKSTLRWNGERDATISLEHQSSCLSSSYYATGSSAERVLPMTHLMTNHDQSKIFPGQNQRY